MSGGLSREQDISTVTTFTLDGSFQQAVVTPTAQPESVNAPSNNNKKQLEKKNKQTNEKKIAGVDKNVGNSNGRSRQSQYTTPSYYRTQSPLASPRQLQYNYQNVDRMKYNESASLNWNQQKWASGVGGGDRSSYSVDPNSPLGRSRVNLVRWKAKGYREPKTAEGKGERGDGASSIIKVAPRKMNVVHVRNGYDSEEVPPNHSSHSKRTDDFIRPKKVEKQVSFADQQPNVKMNNFYSPRKTRRKGQTADTSTDSEQRRLNALLSEFRFDRPKAASFNGSPIKGNYHVATRDHQNYDSANNIRDGPSHTIPIPKKDEDNCCCTSTGNNHYKP